MDSDLRSYFRFTGKGRLEKSINSLLGLLEGIAIDGKVTDGEISMLRMWLADHQDVASRHPYSELVPALVAAVADGALDPDEREDLTWLCQRLRSTEFFDMVTADLQRLHALVGGIAADGRISTEEMRGLSEWLSEHAHLQTCWPYDEISTLTTKALSDGRVDETEQRMLLDFFTEFLAVLDERTIVRPIAFDGPEQSIGALCAVGPEVTFPSKTFCFTGASSKYKRADFEGLVQRLGGETLSGVSTKLHYLVIGAEGNPCWAFACYGRKVEKAVALRRKGVRVVILHENDFHDAVLDAG
ncbi:NAD-dependent DNA ligase [Hydrogenophaga intermedia]|uniref:NAD-dependent DNA ligase n=1 Tax=Hydrogenophaga intermedia TaxID=65786 RepID=A0A1L1PXS1_HYDIT|nr:NAD-dependent DNA ligase [Hydrogenophaga intermedia]TMU78367.1 NAD-dependent DNA ligase [Hydrogenophaga intermedia]CDN90115.1 NAD-dependent DNA ligase [Hydrogenophaga intermedia]